MEQPFALIACNMSKPAKRRKLSNRYTNRFSIVLVMKITFMREQFGGARRLFDNFSHELMDISTLVTTLSVFFTACWTGRDVSPLELSCMYPPKNVTDENICLLDWASSKAVCESKIRPVSKGRLYRFDGKEVFFTD